MSCKAELLEQRMLDQFGVDFDLQSSACRQGGLDLRSLPQARALLR